MIRRRAPVPLRYDVGLAVRKPPSESPSAIVKRSVAEIACTHFDKKALAPRVNSMRRPNAEEQFRRNLASARHDRLATVLIETVLKKGPPTFANRERQLFQQSIEHRVMSA